MSDIVINSKYAPGITTYGIPGANGANGNAGYGLYYLPFEYDDNHKEYIYNKISNNIIITNNKYAAQEQLILVDRKYQTGDWFLTPSGKIYRLTLDNNNISLSVSGTIIPYSKLFTSFIDNDGTQYIKTTKNIIITNDSSLELNDLSKTNDSSLELNDLSKTNDSSFALNVINKKNILSCKNNNTNDGSSYFNIRFDGSQYVFASNNPIKIQNLIVEYDASFDNSYNNKKVLTVSDFDANIEYNNDNDNDNNTITIAVNSINDYIIYYITTDTSNNAVYNFCEDISTYGIETAKFICLIKKENYISRYIDASKYTQLEIKNK